MGDALNFIRGNVKSDKRSCSKDYERVLCRFSGTQEVYRRLDGVRLRSAYT